MKMLKGIFDDLTREFDSGISDKSKLVRDEIIYGSGNPSGLVSETMEASESIRDAIKKEKRQFDEKASKLFELPGFSKDEMSSAIKKITKHPAGNMDLESLNEQAQKKIEETGKDFFKTTEDSIRSKKEDLMSVVDEKWKSKFNDGFDI